MVVLLQVKPYHMDQVMDSLKPHITERHLIISIVAGMKLAWLENCLPDGTRVVRLFVHGFQRKSCQSTSMR